MPSRAARRAGRASSPGRRRCARGFPRSACPASPVGLQARDITIAEALKPLGYATGQFGKNHLGDRNEYLPTVHGFDEFFGNLYHLNAEEEPENFNYPQIPGVQGAVRPARRPALQGDGCRRCDRAAALGPGRQADDRGHRPAHQKAHGDDRRRDLGCRHRLHRPSGQGEQAVLLLDERDAHASAHARAGRASRASRGLPPGPNTPTA